MRSRFQELLHRACEEEISKYQQSLGEGAADDYPAYREMVGLIKGLRGALALSEQIGKDME